ncbi:hypothetical protein EN943_30790 [Mesorhizobium sp. M7A.F.Ca.US.006.01.1.1]|uniref:hypothetical protein n=1 Tax=Mesorhizobium sp. M7A.F.Ca.US.006.01.1.1 TaxID=2496707 RepID=UPI000FC99928|nr:hypothetical protein [Mesorhizobium sp. M7A.F.Ca.US.006.01.1.1]RUZ72330.1 hypothetical protein EN943_30790 [Mesorhizobium sp. M7A.F.Ca.US.006.01.1.1]
MLERDGTLATIVHARSSIAFYVVVTPDGFSFQTSGVYHDVIVKRATGWKFKSLTVTLDTPR